MDEDEPRKVIRTHEVGMPIDTMSVDELQHRIGMLEEEIARLRAAIAEREKSRNAAAAAFKF